MLGLDDAKTKALLSEEDWKEIISDLPPSTLWILRHRSWRVSGQVYRSCQYDGHEKDLGEATGWPSMQAHILLYGSIVGSRGFLSSLYCWLTWTPNNLVDFTYNQNREELFNSESSPFPVASQLDETWWKDNAWSIRRRLATRVKDAFTLMGEKTGHDSSDRRNQDIATDGRKKIGVKTDFLWRTTSLASHHILARFTSHPSLSLQSPRFVLRWTSWF